MQCILALPVDNFSETFTGCLAASVFMTPAQMGKKAAAGNLLKGKLELVVRW